MTTTTTNRLRRAGWLLLAFGIAWLDLWSKGLWQYPDGDRTATLKVVFESWLQVRATYNVGGVWSLPIPTWILTWVTGLAVPLLAAWLLWPARAPRIETFLKALILGGAIGNFYDRFRFARVRDWIDVYFGGVEGWHWPTFNVADIALVVGVVTLLVLSFFEERREPAE